MFTGQRGAIPLAFASLAVLKAPHHFECGSENTSLCAKYALKVRSFWHITHVTSDQFSLQNSAYSKWSWNEAYSFRLIIIM